MFAESLKGRILLVLKQIFHFVVTFKASQVWINFQIYVTLNECWTCWSQSKSHILWISQTYVNVAPVKMEQSTKRPAWKSIVWHQKHGHNFVQAFLYMFHIKQIIFGFQNVFLFCIFFKAIIKWSMHHINKCPTNLCEIGCQTWFQAAHSWMTVYFFSIRFKCNTHRKCCSNFEGEFHYLNLICTKSSTKFFPFD